MNIARFSKIGLWLIRPFNEGLHFFILTLILSSFTEVIGFAIFESLPKGVFIALHHYIICYFLTLLVFSFKGLSRNILKGSIGVLLGINYLIDLVCVYSFHFTFDQEVPAIILGTNSNEATEFIHMFLPPLLWVILASGIIGIICIYKLLKHWNIQISRNLQYIGIGLVILCLTTVTAMDSKNWGNISVTKVMAFANASSPPDLKTYQVNPNIKLTGQKQPSYVVMIVGESFAKSHSSLYGYNQPTNPNLDSIRQTGQLIVFNHVSAPALNTVPVFKSLMSTYKPEVSPKEWYECLTLSSILHSSGYHTSWFSNQSQKGYHDNIVAKYAALFNKSIFAGNRFAAMGKNDLDETLINIIKQNNQNETKNHLQFHLIHLMGSHPEFKKRYPIDYDYFKPENYNKHPKNQRVLLAEYDNSILYNDYVVNELLKLYADKEAIVFYFSDHGLDVFNSRNDYVGHGRYNNPKSAKAGFQIPFVTYITPSFQNNFPDLSLRVRKSSQNEFCTHDMIYTIMDVIGVQFSTNNKVQEYSLFSQKSKQN